MKQNRDFAYIFAREESGDKKLLIKVRKQDGLEVDKIIFENMKPIYELDPATQTIYYIYENELRIFDAKK